LLDFTAKKNKMSGAQWLPVEVIDALKHEIEVLKLNNTQLKAQVFELRLQLAEHTTFFPPVFDDR
jgi:hypothetical protein